MTTNEKKLIDAMKNDWQILKTVSKKLDFDNDIEAENYAIYLENEGLIRTNKMPSDLSPTGYIFLVAKPIKKEESKIWKSIERTRLIVELFVLSIGILKYKQVLLLLHEIWNKFSH